MFYRLSFGSSAFDAIWSTRSSSSSSLQKRLAIFKSCFPYYLGFGCVEGVVAVLCRDDFFLAYCILSSLFPLKLALAAATTTTATATKEKKEEEEEEEQQEAFSLFSLPNSLSLSTSSLLLLFRKRHQMSQQAGESAVNEAVSGRGEFLKRVGHVLYWLPAQSSLWLARWAEKKLGRA